MLGAQIEESFKLKKNFKKRKKEKSEKSEFIPKASEDIGNCPIALHGHWNMLL